MKKDYIIQVAPLLRLPLAGTQVFSYLHEKALSSGALVEIPFYRRTLQGIVISSKKDFPRSGGMKLKRVKLVMAENFLDSWQIELARELGRYYLSPPGLFLKSMVPKIPRKETNLNFLKKGRIFRKAVGKKYSPEKKNTLIVGPAKERWNHFCPAIAGGIKKGKQILFVFPEIFAAYEASRELKKTFPAQEVLLFHGKLARGEYFRQWKKVRSGKAKIIVSTKVGVFLPFRNLGEIIVEEEQDASHKQWDMSPRYNAGRASLFLARISAADIIFGSAFPSIETYQQARAEKWKILRLGNKMENQRNLEIVDVFEERKSSDFPLSKPLVQKIDAALSEKKKILVLAKRRGYSTFSICENCKSLLKCPECERALVYFEEESVYRCLHCSHRADLFSACPECGAHQLSQFGFGTQLIAKKMKRLFPSVRILRFDADSLKTLKKYEESRKNMENNEYDIVIGTLMMLKMGAFFSFDLVVAASDADFRSEHEFDSAEKALGSLVTASWMTKEDGIFIVQSAFPSSGLLAFLDKKTYNDFSDSELKVRKKFFLPPFSRLIKLSFRDYSLKKAETETRKVFDLLVRTGNNEIEVSEPYEPLVSRKRKMYYKNILVKVKPEKKIEKTPIYSIISGLRKGWAIDVDPVSTA